MFDSMILKEYVTTGKNVKAALECIDHASPLMAEENWYKLGELMNMNPVEAEKQLRDDANPDVYFWFTIGKDEPAWGLQQPWTEWEEKKEFSTKVEAENAHKEWTKKMTGDREFVTGIRRASKSYDNDERAMREIKHKLIDLKHDLEYYPKEIERCKQKLEESNAKIPEMEKKLKEAEEAFAAKHGKLPLCW